MDSLPGQSVFSISPQNRPPTLTAAGAPVQDSFGYAASIAIACPGVSISGSSVMNWSPA